MLGGKILACGAACLALSPLKVYLKPKSEEVRSHRNQEMFCQNLLISLGSESKQEHFSIKSCRVFLAWFPKESDLCHFPFFSFFPYVFANSFWSHRPISTVFVGRTAISETVLFLQFGEDRQTGQGETRSPLSWDSLQCKFGSDLLFSLSRVFAGQNRRCL